MFKCIICFLFLNIVSTAPSQIPGIVYQKCINNNEISMTFDDGPTNNTEVILDILNNNNVTATFFINGIHLIKENLYNVVKRLYNENHTIGTHTFSHPDLTLLNDFNVQRELYDNELIIRNLTGQRPLLFRPPYFDYDSRIINYAITFGYIILVSNLDTYDWSSLNSSDIYNVYTQNIINNDSFISLNHEQIIESVQVLDKIIKYVKSQNFTFVSMKDCLGFENIYQQDNLYKPFLSNSLQKI